MVLAWHIVVRKYTVQTAADVGHFRASLDTAELSPFESTGAIAVNRNRVAVGDGRRASGPSDPRRAVGPEAALSFAICRFAIVVTIFCNVAAFH